MKKAYNRCLLIIEQNAEEAEDSLHLNAAQGALIKVTTGWQVPYLFSQGVSHTVDLVVQIALQEKAILVPVQQKTRWGYRPKAEERRRYYLLEGINGVGPKKAKALIARFGSLQNIFNASAKELQEAEGVHEALARYIHELVRRGT